MTEPKKTKTKKLDLAKVLTDVLNSARETRAGLERSREHFVSEYRRLHPDGNDEKEELPNWLHIRLQDSERSIREIVRELRAFERWGDREPTDEELKRHAERALTFLSNEHLLAECVRRGFLQLDDESEPLQQ